MPGVLLDLDDEDLVGADAEAPVAQVPELFRAAARAAQRVASMTTKSLPAPCIWGSLNRIGGLSACPGTIMTAVPEAVASPTDARPAIMGTRAGISGVTA